MLEINPNKYTLVTQLIGNIPLCAAYGMILPGGEKNSQWHYTVNLWILKSDRAAEIWKTWFNDFLPYIREILDACQAIPTNSENLRELTKAETLSLNRFKYEKQ